MAPSLLGFPSLLAIVIGSMLGAGFFNLPQNLAACASPLTITMSWLLTAFGIAQLAGNYHFLAQRVPDSDNGLYGYIEQGLGRFWACFAVWGYWCSCWLGNMAYLLLIAGAVSYCFPTLDHLFVASLLLWGTHFLTLQGMHILSRLNNALTVLKLLLLGFSLCAMFSGFNWSLFISNWTQPCATLPALPLQLTDALLITAWGFVGFEGALILAERAQQRRDVKRAIYWGVACTLFLYLLSAWLPFGLLHHDTLSTLPSPAMAAILGHVLGTWAEGILSLGVILFGGGALCAWTLFAVELPFLAARGNAFPACFAHTNPRGVPSNALWCTSAILQLSLLLVHLFQLQYLQLVNTATMAILPLYGFSAAYTLRLPQVPTTVKRRCWLGLLYLGWLLYASLDLIPIALPLIFIPGLLVAYATKARWI